MALSKASTELSIRLTKKDATECTCEGLVAFSTPAINASMTAPYRLTEKISVTLTLIPSAISAVIAGSPSTVAGTLIMTLGRSTICHNSLAAAIVPSVS
ncbi:unannotated protein [freshwater metagenome]|uniref:Unannotated protein n=1 Tax=freshwater metagenome TaxID=449393 RepID=A0A6J6TGI9_9ZZZZ